MRIVAFTVGLAALAACSGQQGTTEVPGNLKIGTDQRAIATVTPEEAGSEGQRVVRLPPADVTVGNVSVFNGAFPVAMSFAMEECMKVNRTPVRLSDDKPDGFVQFNCVPFGKAP